MLFYNVNTAECHEFSRDAAREQILPHVRIALEKGEAPIPGNEDFILRVHRRGKNAVFTVNRFNVTPIVACAFVGEENDEQQIWAGIIKLVPPGSGFHRLDPLMPSTRPWLALALLPGHIFVREGVAWVTEYCMSAACALEEACAVS